MADNDYFDHLSMPYDPDMHETDSNPPGGSNSEHEFGVKKRTRTSFNMRQLNGLERAFQLNHSPDMKAREEIGQQLQLSERTVRYWFQNRRQKIRELFKATEPSVPSQERNNSESSTNTPPPPVVPQPRYSTQRYPPTSGLAQNFKETRDSPMAGGEYYPPRITHAGHRPSEVHTGHYAHYDEYQSRRHQCCSCMDDMGHLIDELAAAVPGLSSFGSTRKEVLQATLMYVNGIQSAVNGMTRTQQVPYDDATSTARPFYSTSSWPQPRQLGAGPVPPTHSQQQRPVVPPAPLPEQVEPNHTRWSDVTNAVTQKWSEQSRRDETVQRVASDSSTIPGDVPLQHAPPPIQISESSGTSIPATTLLQSQQGQPLEMSE